MNIFLLAESMHVIDNIGGVVAANGFGGGHFIMFIGEMKEIYFLYEKVRMISVCIQQLSSVRE